MSELDFSASPVSINSDALLYEAVKMFKERQIDNIVVLENNLPVGILDIQDLVKLGLVG
jgi:transaldolase